MEAPEGHPLPHDPAPPEPRQLIPERGTLLRGIGLGGLALGAFAGVLVSVQKLGWLAAPIAPLLALAGVLATWAAAIHVTGGEKFDDHPWV